MKKLVTISREYGSGGRNIGKLVAEKLEVPVYDKELIELAAEKSGLSRDIVATAELRAKSAFSYSFASAMTFTDGLSADPISMNDKLFLTQFDIIRQIAEKGNAVIVGRCADYVLRDLPNVTNVFIHADMEDREERCINEYGIKPEDVKKTIKNYDKARMNYYNYHTSQRWGEYENYDLCINTSDITDDKAADLIVEFLKLRTYK